MAVAPTVEKLDVDWWMRLPADRRILVVTGVGGVARHDGSPVLHVDLDSGTGMAEVLEAVSVVVAHTPRPQRRRP